MGKWSCATEDSNEDAHVQSRSPKAAPPMRERVAADEGLIATSHASVRLLCGGLLSGAQGS